MSKFERLHSNGVTTGSMIAAGCSAPVYPHTQLGGYDESVPNCRHGCCFPLLRQRRGMGTDLLSKVQ